ncbi:MAG TPA: efflux RND transporter periplasmic adaptor subunit [Ramlibacter sp.]|uniref:efflux RND transporter periplasmic adaptor subunit n=1 Tax=Ramlibacter sp. TaxID=1917967 RepID=UPI002ED3A253
MKHALFCGLALFAAAAGAQAPQPVRPANVLPPAGVQSASLPVAMAPTFAAGDPREIRAQLAPRRFTTLAAEIGAKVSRIAVSEGGSFRAGQLLVAFDCGLQRAQHDKARAALTGSEKAWQANTRLAELHSIGRVELDLSEAEVAKNRAEVNAMGTMLNKCSIAAPFGGRVAEQKVREQQYAQPGQPLLEIIDDSVLELEFLVPSRWLAWLKPGHQFKVSIDEAGKTFPAKVQRIGARVDPVSQSIKLTATIDGRFPELVAGMSGRVSMTPPSP